MVYDHSMSDWYRDPSFPQYEHLDSAGSYSLPPTYTEPSVVIVLASPDGRRLVINDDSGNALVTVWANGELEFGDGYDPDEAAHRFWSALADAGIGFYPTT